MSLNGITLFELGRSPPINLRVSCCYSSSMHSNVCICLDNGAASLFIINAIVLLIFTKNNKPVLHYYTMMLESMDGISNN